MQYILLCTLKQLLLEQTKINIYKNVFSELVILQSLVKIIKWNSFQVYIERKCSYDRKIYFEIYAMLQMENKNIQERKKCRIAVINSWYLYQWMNEFEPSS